MVKETLPFADSSRNLMTSSCRPPHLHFNVDTNNNIDDDATNSDGNGCVVMCSLGFATEASSHQIQGVGWIRGYARPVLILDSMILCRRQIRISVVFKRLRFLKSFAQCAKNLWSVTADPWPRDFVQQ